MVDQSIANKQTQPNVANKSKFFKKQAGSSLNVNQTQQQRPTQQPQATSVQQQKQPQVRK